MCLSCMRYYMNSSNTEKARPQPWRQNNFTFQSLFHWNLGDTLCSLWRAIHFFIAQTTDSSHAFWAKRLLPSKPQGVITETRRIPVKFASFHLAFNTWTGVGNKEHAEPRASLAQILQSVSRVSVRVDLGQVLHGSRCRLGSNAASVLVTTSLPPRGIQCMPVKCHQGNVAGWEGVRTRRWTQMFDSMCRIFSFRVYSAVNCSAFGPLFWAQLSLELGLLVCFRSATVSSACLPAWLTLSELLPLSPQFPLCALPQTWTTVVFLLHVLPWSDLLSTQQRGKVC